MKISSLEALNVDRELLEIWQRTVGERLLPVQERAVRELGLLGPNSTRNLIVFSPTSSGKTFVGEMAMVQAARQNRKVFYLVPLKALAEEKYEELRDRYDDAGIRVIVSSRDHSEFDTDILGLNFGIAVVVYEKLQSLLVGYPTLIERTGLVVVDELQILTDPVRGPSLELLLTKLITAKKRPRIIGLSAVLGNAERLAKWLEAELLVENHRPVELRKGVLHRGTFKYREHNTGNIGTEEFPDLGDVSKNEAKLAAVEHMVGLGEQVLIFEETRVASVRNALLAADRLRLPIVQEGVDALAEREDTLASRNLREALESSIAFHNSDLSPEERSLVERLFRAGEIRAVFSTPTLAMGVNLPVKNVIVPTDKWGYYKQYRRWGRKELTKSDYENMSGRAGRYSLTPDFGRSLLVADSKWNAKVWMDCFVDADFEDIEPTLKDASLADHLLDLLASKLASTTEEAGRLLMHSFTGQSHWMEQSGQQKLQESLDAAVEDCRNTGMLQPGTDKLVLSKLGQASASTGVKMQTAKAFGAWLTATADLPIAPLDVLTVLSFTANADESYIPMAKHEHDNREYKGQLIKVAQGLALLDRPIIQPIHESRFSLVYEEGKRVKKVLMLHGWMEEHRTADIESAYLAWGGAIQRVAEEFGWMAEGLAQAAGALGWSKPRQLELRRIGRRIARGVREDLLPISRLKVRGLGRVYLRRLANAGLATHAALKLASLDELQLAINRHGLAERLFEYLHRNTDSESDEVRTDKLEGQEEHTEGSPKPATYRADASVVPRVCHAAEESPPYGSEHSDHAHTLHFVGTCSSRRYLLQIDGHDIWAPNQPFRLLWVLATHRLREPAGWIHTSNLGLSSDPYRAISRVRRLISPYSSTGTSGVCWIQNNGHGSYRLALEVSVSWNDVSLSAEHPDLNR
jgi:ATP-dependent DNA helicase